MHVRSSLVTLLLTCLGASGSTTAHAQLQASAQSGNYGSVQLGPGFTPDPHAVSVTSGGTLDVRSMGLGAACVGFASAQPDYVVSLTGTLSRLRFFVEAGGDTGLVINDAQGNWRCNDDSNGGRNPMVDISNASPGHYDVWITSYQSGTNTQGTLNVTELDRRPGGSTGPTSSAGTSAPQLEIGSRRANYGTLTIRAGFPNDPRSVAVVSGGTLDVRAMNLGSGCVGYATRRPDYIVKLRTPSSMLRFYVTAPGDTGLLVNDAQNSWLCNDDSYGGRNPTVDIDDAPAGQYDVWVTSYQSGENINGRLFVTELDANHPGGGSGDITSIRTMATQTDPSISSGALDTGSSSASYGRISLASGFAPDPQTVSVRSGGTLDIRSMNLGSGCVGFATRQPDYIVNLTSTSSMLRFYVTAPGDTGLVINDAGGRWVCNDDSYGGRNPSIDFQNATPGQYDIWVTSYQSGQNVNGTLNVTELSGRHP